MSLARLAADGVDLYTMQFVIDIGGPIDVPMLRRPRGDAGAARQPAGRVLG
ncbi:hypothetical protein AB0L63_07295 [Nocardia sp. NPDC051990]|uniref:hypothetical protein n=1 Tax=Nocardia sp. NPDC051990 TaxID=3155285 RepID=UPI00342E0D59